jgi:antitoxin component of MazEF toxin-antitoxin module
MPDPVPVLTITAKGQVMLPQRVLKHLGVTTGGTIRIELLPGGRCIVTAEKRTGSIEDFIGLLKGKTAKVATIDEINAAIAAGWARRSASFTPTRR